uniref:Uncharacterized protein n=1 Tax=Panagrolaimus sp. ES5 TaxID=591445 RepID=A0AC34G224_9BILA
MQTDPENIEDRNKFMLALLFVAFWVADKKEGCPNVILKKPMAQLVRACFRKYFKDIYRGNDENFNAFIFADNKENLFYFSSHRSLNTSALPSRNVTPNVQKSVQSKMLTCDDVINRLTS